MGMDVNTVVRWRPAWADAEEDEEEEHNTPALCCAVAHGAHEVQPLHEIASWLAS